jgi:hypothetical protein
MSRRSWFIILVLALGLAASAILYVVLHRRGPGIPTAGAPPALLDLAPQDSTALVYADVAALRASPFLTQLAALAPAPNADRDYAEFIQATGFQYERDLDRVVIALRSEGSDSGTFAIADGRFDRKRITAYALRTGRRATLDGMEVIAVPEKPPVRPVTLAFLGEHRILLANSANLAPLLAQAAAARPGGTLQPEMRERVSRVAGAPVFAVGKLGPSFQRAVADLSAGGLRSDQLDNLLRSLRWLSFAARPEGNALRVALEGETASTRDALQISTTLEGLRLLGKLALADPKTRRQMDPASLALADSILKSADVSRDTEGDVHRVRLTFAITAGQLLPESK